MVWLGRILQYLQQLQSSKNNLTHFAYIAKLNEWNLPCLSGSQGPFPVLSMLSSYVNVILRSFGLIQAHLWGANKYKRQWRTTGQGTYVCRNYPKRRHFSPTCLRFNDWSKIFMTKLEGSNVSRRSVLYASKSIEDSIWWWLHCTDGFSKCTP